MPLFIGIPFTLLLVGVTLALSWVVNFNLSLVLIGGTTAWAAWDARRLEVPRYRTQLALPTFPQLEKWIDAGETAALEERGS